MILTVTLQMVSPGSLPKIFPRLGHTLLDTDDTHSDSPDGGPWIPPYICLGIRHTLLDTDDTHSDSPDGEPWIPLPSVQGWDTPC